jgi:hypothetical protein
METIYAELIYNRSSHCGSYVFRDNFMVPLKMVAAGLRNDG